MGQRSVYLEAASKINDRKILHKSAKIRDKAIEWLQTQNDKDGLGAMRVCRGKYHKYLVTSCDYSKKEIHLIDYSRGGLDQSPVPGGKNDGWLMCYVNAPFVMQPNMLSYTGGELTMGKGSPMVEWGKPELNMKSLTESELVGVNDMMPIMFWIRDFLLEQGEGIVVDLLLDNKPKSVGEKW